MSQHRLELRPRRPAIVRSVYARTEIAQRLNAWFRHIRNCQQTAPRRGSLSVLEQNGSS